MTLFGIMFVYMYVFRPFLILRADGIGAYLTTAQIERGLLVNLLGVAGFCLGGIRDCRKLDHHRIGLTMPADSGNKIHSLGVLLGVIGCVGYAFGLLVSGGFKNVYSQAKGQILASSGYLGELPLLCYPAIMLVMLARRGREIRQVDWTLALCFAIPQLLHGILGARRGPTFLVVSTLFFSWFIASGRRPKLIPLLLSLSLSGTLIFFLISHRDQIYIGSDIEVDLDKVWNTAFPSKADAADDVVFGIALTNVADATGRHYWGTRFLVVLFARPIPRQIWPTKYEDTGFGWMVQPNNLLGYSFYEWQQCLGWRPPSGASGGFASDLFVEFWWGSAFAAYALGAAFSILWRKAAMQSGLWTVLFLEAMILSVYIPTQTVSALLHRFIFMAVLTLLLWKMRIGRMGAGQIQPAADQPVVLRRI